MARTKKKSRRRKIMRRNVVRPEDTLESLGDIAKRLRKASGRGTARKSGSNSNGGIVQLKLNALQVAEKAFQWRTFGPNRLPSDDHILEMARV
jgi:hypothetical protein